MSRVCETELTDLQPAHMLQLLLHANKNFESDSTLRDRHINFIQQIISSSIVSSTVYVRVNILFPQLRFLEKRKRTKCQKTQPTMTDVVFVLKQGKKHNKEYLHSPCVAFTWISIISTAKGWHHYDVQIALIL